MAENREKNYTYRMPVERHTSLKVLSAERGVDIQDIIDQALDAYLGNVSVTPQSRELRELCEALSSLYEKRETAPYDLEFRIVREVLRTARKQLGL